MLPTNIISLMQRIKRKVKENVVNRKKNINIFVRFTEAIFEYNMFIHGMNGF